jgi:hypothetical protein
MINIAGVDTVLQPDGMFRQKNVKMRKCVARGDHVIVRKDAHSSSRIAYGPDSVARPGPTRSFTSEFSNIILVQCEFERDFSPMKIKL